MASRSPGSNQNFTANRFETDAGIIRGPGVCSSSASNLLDVEELGQLASLCSRIMMRVILWKGNLPFRPLTVGTRPIVSAPGEGCA